MANRWYHLALALVLWSLHLCHPYDLKCPENQHFKLRAAAKCPENPKKYVCLNNTLEDQYQEKCARLDYNPEGTKVVFQPNLHKANCSKSRYQPIIFETWMNSDCIFLKSECTEEGQAVYSTGSTVADVNCTCDYTKGYTFVTTPANKCYCVPSVEDCSCYMPGCKVSQDHFCENTTTGTQNNRSTPLCQAIDEYHNNVQVNKSSLKEAMENITKAETQAGTTAFVVLGLICCTPICMCISVYVYRKLRITFQLKNDQVLAITGNTVKLEISFSTKLDESRIQCQWVFKANYGETKPRGKSYIENGVCILEINDVKQEDGADYTCILIPRFGTKVKSPTIHLSTITFQLKCNNVPAIIGETVELKLPFSCNETIPSIELVDGNKESYPERIWFLQDNQCVLKITDVKQEDEGDYTCILRPKGGQEIKCPTIRLSTIEETVLSRIHKEMLEGCLSPYYFDRVMVVGKQCVGKTSLVNKLLSAESVEGTTSTHGIDVSTCRLQSSKYIWGKIEDEKDDFVKTIAKLKIVKGKKDVPQMEISSQSPTSLSNDMIGSEIKSPTEEADDGYKDVYYQQDVELHPPIKMTQSKELPNPSYEKIVAAEQISINNTTKSKEAGARETSNAKENTFRGTSAADKDDKFNVKALTTLTKSFLYTIAKQNHHKDNCTKCDETMNLVSVWDFAGEKDFYATHQAFLTSCAVYILVTDIKDLDKNKELRAETANSIEYLNLWLDIIHCYSNETKEVNPNEKQDPPVLVVCTKTDKWGDQQPKETKKDEFVKTLKMMLSGHRSEKHIREPYLFVSNTEDEDTVFEKLRKDISNVAIDLNEKRREIPLKWRLFLYILNNISLKVIPILKLKEIAGHENIRMDWDDFIKCLTFFHSIGHILFYDKKNTHDNVILDPNWLADAFGCIVSETKIEKHIKDYDEDWNRKLKKTGELTYRLLSKLFEKRPYLNENQHYLIAVMKKFDIIVNFRQENKMFVPCMMETVEFEQIEGKIVSTNKTPWMCLEYEFLPPAFFNHMLVLMMRQYKVFKFYNDTEQCDQFALYRNIGVFELDECKKKYLILREARNIIAVQIWSLDSSNDDYTHIKQQLQLYQEKISKRYRLRVKNEISYKCCNGDFKKNRIQREALSGDTYGCVEHGEVHNSKDILQCWCYDGHPDLKWVSEWQLLTLKEIIENIAKSAVKEVFDKEFGDALWIEMEQNKQKIYDLHRRSHIDYDGTSMLLSKGKNVTTKDFGINLMNVILRNLKGLKILSPEKRPRHDNIVEEFGWICQEERFKTEKEKNLTGVNFYRILFRKNRFQPYNNKMFKQYYDSLSKILSDLGGEEFKTKCEEVKNKFLQQHLKQHQEQLRQ